MESWIELFTPKDETPFHPAFSETSQVSQSMSVDVAATILRTWLKICDGAHPLCQTTSKRLPQRILNISSNSIKLCEFPKGQAPDGSYVTMSHCWGTADTEKPTTTTTYNLQQRKARIAMEELSPVFRDAIQLCRLIGCGYIWIDSLCIIQDNDLDWIEQSQDMAQIYSNAYFNIAPSWQPNGSFGLFENPAIGSGQQPHRREVEIKLGAGTRVLARQDCGRDHGYIQRTVNSFRRRYREAPLLERAWVFQEVLLARVNVCFCSSELIWECRTTFMCECGCIPPEDEHFRGPKKQQFTLIRGHPILPSPSVQMLYNFWWEASEHYSFLSLTKLPDRFYALSGMASIIKMRTNDSYFAGIWANDLPQSLLWTGVPLSSRTARRTRLAPSWSWMSRYEENNRSSMRYFFGREIFRQAAGLQLGSPRLSDSYFLEYEFGPVHHAEIRLKVASISAVVSSVTGGSLGLLEILTRPVWETVKPTLDVKLYADCPESPDEILRQGDLVEWLHLGNNNNMTDQYILVVKRCNGAQVWFYRRVGVLDFDLSDSDDIRAEDPFAGVESKWFTLI
ncbi:HET-domain-containing protein [Hyaloscypha variabilis F]|uniref:HET-domain-containing protein n=1 Tax=Hyaloscypha variabilis (strain UAMH 11265 / GT02V1 / F) TaxID=1149755 RepID=A0A2J6S5B3_HYAVF|nr:HET-domain-containing protein [Hyaloscypha variabilis F]